MVAQSVYNEKVVEGEEKASPSEDGEALKSSELPVVSLVSKEEEDEDLGWDEIEDIEGNHDEKKVSVGGRLNRSDLRKRLSGADEEEDLSWDIEDDDEPVKH
ncbi:hypothetical protein IFM89_000961 [Coptis chinensis]|uniref:Uncharacterized protein n=1 Tax=Coptis chinensis TaxID=261450 RepID=A0A835MC47_9MAGN|nr:hypothetical protein IFM89_000961 [Coptis chinensis]